jgi:hypothetical protein
MTTKRFRPCQTGRIQFVWEHNNNSGVDGKERVDAYACAALDHAAAAIVSAPKGAQAVTLHRACYAIGGLVAIGALDYRDVYVELTEAARRMPAYGEPWTRLERKVEASLRRCMERPWTPLKGRGRPQTTAARQCQPQASVGSGNGRRSRRCRDAVVIDAGIAVLVGRARE